MDIQILLETLHLMETLKNITRHCDTSNGRRESVAEHCWRASVMADLMRDEFPEADMNRVVRMCIWHDLGEVFTGDIPVFEKTSKDEIAEQNKLNAWVGSLPEPYCTELFELFEEMEAMETLEAKVYKAIDSMEALIQHNESEISTWLPLEYDLQMTYANERTAFNPYLNKLRDLVREESKEKIRQSDK